MPEILVFPPHINRAKAALISAGISVSQDSPAYAALMMVAIAWERTPQANRAEELRQEVVKTQHELEDVSADLLTARKDNARLADLLTEKEQPPQLLSSKASKEVANLLKANARLREQLENGGVTPPHSRKQELNNLKSQVGSLRQELANRPAHNDEKLAAMWKDASGQKDRLRRSLRRINKVLADVDLPADEKLARVAALTAHGLEVGTPAEAARNAEYEARQAEEALGQAA